MTIVLVIVIIALLVVVGLLAMRQRRSTQLRKPAAEP